MTKDFRRHERVLLEARIDIIWQNERQESCFARCKCLDISSSGMKLECPDPVPIRAFVNFQMNGNRQFRGSGSVRSCARKGMRYQLGVEFGSGLKWQFLDDEVEQPA